MLWKYFFSAWLMKHKVGAGDNVTSLPTDIGSVLIYPSTTRLPSYLYAPTPSGHSGWHKRWFYLHNDGPWPFPAFTMCLITNYHQAWEWGPGKDEWLGIEDTVKAI